MCLALGLWVSATANGATPIVQHGDVWRLHKGVSAPEAGWAVIPEDQLGASWEQAAGGFGYGDAVPNEATPLGDMEDRYSTLYARRSFVLAAGAPTGSQLLLTIDYDDAYIAYLDGVEISRSPNAPAGSPSHTALATTRHEASCCDAPVNPVEVVNLGPVGDRLGPGFHVFAIQGFNDDLSSSDFHLVAELELLEAGECPTNSICANTVWTAANGPIILSADTTVRAGASLVIEAGAQVRLLPGVSLRAGPSASIDVRGTPTSPVVFASGNGTDVWGELAADGADSSLAIRHADVSGGAVQFRNGATGLIEDSYIHHFKSGSTPIAGCTDAKSVVVRRSHFNVYHETLWRFTPTLIEDSLFENADNPSSDALDFDGAPTGSVIRRCTFRHGPQTNTDAIDIGSGSMGVVIEDCLMFNFPNDKGVSIGEDSHGIIVRNCLFYGCESAIAVKDSCTAAVYGCTLVANEYGFRNYNKADPASPIGGGHVTNSHNNILWANTVTVSLENGATLVADHSDFSVVAWLGMGNIMADPMFVDPQKRDYRVAPESPVTSAGREGTPMGARFPVGAPMAASHPSFAAVTLQGSLLRLGFWVDSARSLSLLTSEALDPASWSAVTRFPSGPLPKWTEFTVEAADHPHYFRLTTD